VRHARRLGNRRDRTRSSLVTAPRRSRLGGLNRHLAKELGPFGIAVNAVAPGIIASDPVQAKLETYTEAERAAVNARIRLGRIGTIDEVASVASTPTSHRGHPNTAATGARAQLRECRSCL
jgi:3-oxoacyl-[acyl-carrier protein] reductase